MADKLTATLALGVLVLAVALLFPTLINATNSADTANLEIYENNSNDITERLSVEATTVEPALNRANITVENTDTLDSSVAMINESETHTYTVNNDTVNVTLDTATADGGDVVLLSVEYSPMFGWDGGARTFMEQMELVLAAVGGIIILGLLGLASRI